MMLHQRKRENGVLSGGFQTFTSIMKMPFLILLCFNHKVKLRIEIFVQAGKLFFFSFLYFPILAMTLDCEPHVYNIRWISLRASK